MGMLSYRARRNRASEFSDSGKLYLLATLAGIGILAFAGRQFLFERELNRECRRLGTEYLDFPSADYIYNDNQLMRMCDGVKNDPSDFVSSIKAEKDYNDDFNLTDAVKVWIRNNFA